MAFSTISQLILAIAALHSYRASGRLGAIQVMMHRGTGRVRMALACHRGTGRFAAATGYRGSEHGAGCVAIA